MYFLISSISLTSIFSNTSFIVSQCGISSSSNLHIFAIFSIVSSVLKSLVNSCMLLTSLINPSNLTMNMTFILYFTYDWFLKSVNPSNLFINSGKYWFIIVITSLNTFNSFFLLLFSFLFKKHHSFTINLFLFYHKKDIFCWYFFIFYCEKFLLFFSG